MSLENYEILEELGRGSQGVTYKARQVHTRTIVAIKKLDLKDLEDWKSVELFEREARVLESIQHPNVPKYLDAFSVDQQDTVRLFLVQEYLAGQHLSAALTHRGTWPPARAAGHPSGHQALEHLAR